VANSISGNVDEFDDITYVKFQTIIRGKKTRGLYLNNCHELTRRKTDKKSFDFFKTPRS